MKLYGVGKSRSFRALWALEESCLDYQYIGLQYASHEQGGAQSSQYLALNSQGKVPTLVDGDFVLTESAAIVNYIAAKSEVPDLLPSSDLLARARYDEFCYFIVTELEQGLWTNGKHRFALPEAQRVAAVLDTATWEFNKAMTTLSKMFSCEGYLVGDHFTMADLMLAHTLAWAEMFKFEVAEPFLDYKNRLMQRPACLRALAKLG